MSALQLRAWPGLSSSMSVLYIELPSKNISVHQLFIPSFVPMLKVLV